MNASMTKQMEEARRIIEKHPGEGVVQDQAGQAPPKIKLVWDSTLRASKPTLPEPLIEGYINRGEVSLLAGASKAGKSWMSLQMAKCIGSGIEFLGQKTTPGVCVYINTEIAAPFWALRSSVMTDKLQLQGEPKILHASTRGEAITIANVIPLLQEALEGVKQKQVDFICIDPYYTLAAGLEENAAGEVATAMLGFQKLAEKLNASVLITHHFPKGNAAGKTILDRASGSGVFARSVDNFFTLTENSSGKMVLEGIRRNAASPPPLEVEFEYPLWKAIGTAEAIVPRRRGRDSEYRPELFKEALSNAESLCGSELREKVGNPPAATFSRWKQKAIDEGVILVDHGRFVLAEQASEEAGGNPTRDAGSS